MKNRFLIIASLAMAALMLFTAGKNRKVKLITAGDSTMAANRVLTDDPGDPGRGWVEGLAAYMDTDKIEIDNRAVSGRSSRSFIDEGYWDKALATVGKGDFVLIQFGHNDPKQGDRYTDPQTTYKEYLRRYITGTREKGGIPILATSVVRRRFDRDGKVVDTHGGYPAAMKEVGAEMNVPVVDMEAATRELIRQAGPEQARKYYLYAEPGVAERFPDGVKDDTHLGVDGANAFAQLFVRQIRTMKLPLAKYVKK